MPATVRKIRRVLLSNVDVLLLGPLGTAEPTAEEKQGVITQVAARPAICAPKRREHSLLLVVHKNSDVVARVGDAKATKLPTELGVIAPGCEHSDLDALVAWKYPWQVFDHSGVAAAKATATPRRTTATTAIIVLTQGVHGEASQDGL
eukprot:CAMPEP_0117508504 /NCGR_PEP_ID=MMETSP0784-20121206/26986_1 /TAXON_ID=39447 /ORGANISM="" /LENGTH=147 /DNA_ID=CAMNT_0005304067 /DNA_START=748 /DNA_END=1191 /DNA_ORIENTATION=+